MRTGSLVGSRVLVPLGQRMMTGFVVKLRKKRLDSGIQIKEITEVLDEEPVFSSGFLSFTQKLSNYYYSSWGEVLQASLPPSFILKSQARVSLTEKGSQAVREEGFSREERALLDFLKQKKYSVPFLKRKLKIQNISTLISHLESKGLVQTQRDIKRAGPKRALSVPESESQLEMDFSLDAHSPARWRRESSQKSIISPFLASSFKDLRRRGSLSIFI